MRVVLAGARPSRPIPHLGEIVIAGRRESWDVLALRAAAASRALASLEVQDSSWFSNCPFEAYRHCRERNKCHGEFLLFKEKQNQLEKR